MTAGLREEERAPVASPRRTRRRFSVGHLAVVLAAVLAFAANLAFLRSVDDSIEVVAAARSLGAGEIVSAGDLRTVALRADASVLSTLLTSVEGLEGRVVRSGLVAGQLVGGGDLLAAAAPDGLRSMAIPVSAQHAAGGTIRPGDRVDIIDVVEGVASYVVRDAPVLEVSSTSSGALAVSGGDFLVVGLNEAEVLAVAEAISDGKVDVVVTTGAADG